jgi:hypothetical protein
MVVVVVVVVVEQTYMNRGTEKAAIGQSVAASAVVASRMAESTPHTTQSDECLKQERGERRGGCMTLCKTMYVQLT